MTHNAAILGVLGIGKTFLALELVERMLAQGIKVVALDLTNQYASELGGYYASEEEELLLEELRTIGAQGKENYQRNKETGGSISAFSAKVREHLQRFLDDEPTAPLKIYNPTKFEVWRQTGGLFDGRAAMASLTPTEIARIITEQALAVVQAKGMTEEARLCLVFEEAHSLIPEFGSVAVDTDKEATNGTARAILQGRKFGLGCLVIAQRTASVTKTILNQCNTVFAMRQFDATAMEFLANYFGQDYAGVLSSLEDRHCIVFGRASSCKQPVLVEVNNRAQFMKAFRKPKPE